MCHRLKGLDFGQKQVLFNGNTICTPAESREPFAICHNDFWPRM